MNYMASPINFFGSFSNLNVEFCIQLHFDEKRLVHDDALNKYAPPYFMGSARLPGMHALWHFLTL